MRTLLLLTLIAAGLLGGRCAFAIAHNAGHSFNKDPLTFEDVAIEGSNTRCTPDLDAMYDNSALDEVYLRIRFFEGQTASINRLLEIRYDGQVICTPSANDVRSLVDPNDPQILHVWYGFHDRDTERTVSLGNKNWDFLVTGNDPVSEVWIFVSYHRTGHASMPDLYTTGGVFPSTTGLLGVQSASAVATEVNNQAMTGGALDPTRRKIIILVHGWNGSVEYTQDPNQVTVKNQYAPSPGSQNSGNGRIDFGFQNLAIRSFGNPLIQNEDWQVTRYDWHNDSATGGNDLLGDALIANANASRDGAAAHGLKLGRLLAANSPSHVHFFAHSAGNWTVRRAAAYLKKKFPAIVIQLTSLDPFVNDDEPVTIGDDVDLEDAFALTRVWFDYLENYWADDGASSSTKSDTLGWTSGPYEGWDVNRQIETLNAAGLYESYMDDHAGPISWLGETATPANLGNTTLRNLPEPERFEGFVNSLPIRLWHEQNANIDNFPGQSTSAGSGSVTQYNYRATKQTGEPNHAGDSGSASVWLSWTAPASGTATFDTFSSSCDTLLGVYTGGSVGSLTHVASNDNYNGPQSRVTFTAQAGQTYRVAVDGWNGAVGKVILNWTSQAPTYTVCALAGLHGSVSPPGCSSVTQGGSKTFTATPESTGYVVDKWYRNGVVAQNGSNTYTATNIVSNTDVLVYFKVAPPAGAITVTAPNGGGIYDRGSNMYISWQYNATAGPNVRIELLKGGVINATIASSTPNDGAHTWGIPSSQVIGADYKIRITSTTTSAGDDSDGLFEINDVVKPTRVELRTWTDLRQVSEQWGDAFHPRNAHYVLMNDIDASPSNDPNFNNGLGFKPIGSSATDEFKGVFDGQGYKIIGLNMERLTESHVALFKNVDDGATVKNLTVEYDDCWGNQWVAGIAAENWGTIQNCHVLVDNMIMTNGVHCGAIVGENNRTGKILNCSVYGLSLTQPSRIRGKGDTPDEVGGIAGTSAGVIRWCRVESTVDIDATISGSNGDAVGGIVGANEGGSISECDSRFLRIDGQYYVGGIVGKATSGDVSDCIYRGQQFTGDGQNGGIAGQNDVGCKILRCLASGPVENDGVSGALVGRNNGSLAESYWNTTVTSLPPVGGGSGTVTNVFGKAPEELRRRSTFLGWDFQNIWAITEDDDFPWLRGVGHGLAAPSNLTVSTGVSDGVHVSWNAVPEATFYRVYRSDTADGALVAMSAKWLAETTYLDTTAVPGVTYWYWVDAASTPDGGRQGLLSGSESGSRTPHPVAAPQNVTASDGLPYQVVVQWSLVDEANFYQVFRSTSVDSEKYPISVWQSDSSFSDTGTISGYYWIKAAVDNVGSRASDFSTPDSGYLVIPDTTPHPPSNLTATTNSATSVNLSWSDNSNNEDGFKIEKSENDTNSWVQIGTKGANVTAFTDTNRKPCIENHYRVRAYNASGNSTYSNTATVAGVGCDDGQYCNGQETCNESTGQCENGAWVPCIDDLFCADVVCNETYDLCETIDTSAWVCPDDLFCADVVCNEASNSCDTTDVSWTVCPDNLFCADVACNEATNVCDTTDTSTTVCPDNLFCVDVACNEATNACDSTDVSSIVCDDGNLCNGEETCDEATDSCLLGTPLVCDDGNACTTDSCDATSGCHYESTCGDLLAHWALDEGVGATASDSSGNGNHGSVSGATWRDGLLDQVLSFDGINDHVVVPNHASLNPTNAITIMGWVKANNFTGAPRLVQKGATDNQYSLRFGTSGTIFDAWGLSNVQLTAPAPSVGSWHHVAATYDGAVMKIYLDGVVAAQQNSTGSINLSTDPLAIGTKPGSSSEVDFFDGMIDDVRIYGRALSASEIQGLGGGPVAHWSFAACDATDITGNGHDGTVINSPQCVDRLSGKSYRFDGVDDYISIPDFAVTPANQRAITLWVKPDAGAANDSLVSKHANFYDAELLIRIEADGKYDAEWTIGGQGHDMSASGPDINDATGLVTPSYTKYDMLALTYDGAQIHFYVNGELVASHNAMGSIADNPWPILIGRYALNDAEFFTGEIDDVRIYNRALSAADIQSMYGAAIRLTGDLDFGEVVIGSSSTRLMHICNDGAAPLEVTAVNFPEGFADAESPWSGIVPAGQCQQITVRFSPAETRTYSGIITVDCNAANGDNTRLCSGTGVPQPCAALTAPTSSLPTCGSTVANLVPTLQWGNVSNESGYVVRIYNGGTCVGTPMHTTIQLPADTTSYAVPVGLLGSGQTYLWTVTAIGNGTTYCDSVPLSCCSFTVGDLIAPTCTITQPSSNTVVRGTVTIAANATDNISVSRVEFFRNSSVPLGTDTASPYSISWNSTNVIDGTNSLSALAIDSSSNVTTSASVPIIVDNTPPVASLTAPTNGSTVSNLITMAANATDVRMWKVEFYRDNDQKIGEDTTSPYSMLYDTSAVNNGSHCFYAKAYDAVTNITVTATNCVSVNNPAVAWATHATACYRSPGTNTVTAQFHRLAGRQLLSLLCRPQLPTGWSLVPGSASGDGSPDTVAGEIVFTGTLTANPINLTYRVEILPGGAGDQQVRNEFEYLLDGMLNPSSTHASPDSLTVNSCPLFHCADYQDPRWVIDGSEVSRVLAYWRAGSYHCEPIPPSLDGYGAGTGPTNCISHTADWADPRWEINGTELNRVLSYWRAGCYQTNALSSDGYAPGCSTNAVAIAAVGTNADPSPLTVSSIAHTAGCFTPGNTLVVTNMFNYTGQLLSLLWRPELPAGWTIQSVSGDGSPEYVGGEIVHTGALPSNQVRMYYNVLTSNSALDSVQVRCEAEYLMGGMINPESTYASPDPLAIEKCVIPVKPQPPSGCTARAVASNKFVICWSDNSDNETGFKIKWATSSTGPWKTIPVAANTTCYTHEGLLAAKTYYYKVSAYNSVGRSSWTSPLASAKTQKAGTPNAPSDLDAVAISCSQVNLEWNDNSSNETQFTIQRRASTNEMWVVIGTVGVNVTSFADTNAVASTEYQYRVRAKNAAGNSAWTAVEDETTPACGALTVGTSTSTDDSGDSGSTSMGTIVQQPFPLGIWEMALDGADVGDAFLTLAADGTMTGYGMSLGSFGLLEISGTWETTADGMIIGEIGMTVGDEVILAGSVIITRGEHGELVIRLQNASGELRLQGIRAAEVPDLSGGWNAELTMPGAACVETFDLRVLTRHPGVFGLEGAGSVGDRGYTVVGAVLVNTANRLAAFTVRITGDGEAHESVFIGTVSDDGNTIEAIGLDRDGNELTLGAERAP